ncbi:MAG: hypothetical protein VYE73_15485 [Acidobacteriota bacterium]|nr:hypothetical protein [Acidobacteriota bacterium]
MHDSVALEQAGLPTAAIVTAQFVSEAHTQLAALGLTEFVPVVIEHPLSTLSDDEIAVRATDAAPMVMSTWLGASRADYVPRSVALAVAVD